MIVLRRVTHGKDNCNFAVEAFDILRRKITFRIKDQPVNASVQSKTVWQQIFCAPIRIGRPRADLFPGAIGGLKFQSDWNRTGRTAA